jgi:ribosome maturation factor RimP
MDVLHLIGKQVVVLAHGIEYRGELVEINNEEVYLKTEMGWVTIPVNAISEIRPA